MSFFSKRRFIAGAVCPKCYRPDKTVMYDEALWEVSECIACGFKQQKPREDESDKNIDQKGENCD